MAIFGLKKEIEAEIKEKEDRSLVPLYESEVIDEPVRAFIQGYKWKVTYFHRLINEMDQVTEYDPNLDPTLQDYIRIDNLTLYLQEPLPAGIPDDLKSEAIIDIDFIPNPNDLFIARLIDGKNVIFTVENVERFNYNNDNMFKISFMLYGEYENLEDPLIKKLLESTTEELVYNDEYRQTHTQPLYKKEDFTEREEILRRIEKMINLFEETFIIPEYEFYLAYKDKFGNIVHDPEMEAFIDKVIGFSNLSAEANLVGLKSNTVSILDYLAEPKLPTGKIREFYVKSRPSKFPSNPYVSSLAYSCINYVVELKRTGEYSDNEEINELYPYLPNGRYIFRKEVYDVIKRDEEINIEDLTVFEQLVLQMILREPMEFEDLTELYENLELLNEKHLFYYLPILILLHKYYIITFTVPFV